MTASPLTARAQPSGKLPNIGFLGAGTPAVWSQWTAAFVQLPCCQSKRVVCTAPILENR